MICENPPATNQNHLKLSLKSNILHNNDNNKDGTRSYFSNDMLAENEPSKYKSIKLHWETIEKYYIDRLNSLRNEIDMAIQHNSKLSLARDELVQEILELHQKSKELTIRNDFLSKSISEKEASYPYNHHYPVVGVTLEDKPYHVPAPPSPPTTSTTTSINSSHSSEQQEEETTNSNKPTGTRNGLFRQISLRLSTKKKRHHEESPPAVSSEHNNKKSSMEQEHNIKPLPAPSSSEPLLHPAAVIANDEKRSEKNNKSKYQHRRNHSAYNQKPSIFGHDLVDQAKSENSIIPSIVLKCVREIESRGLNVEGIYRKSGTSVQLKELEDAFNANKDPKLYKCQDIHTITSLLKSYLRSLPTPLISNQFILPSGISEQERLNKTYNLLHELPIETYCTIKFIIQHLKRVHQNQSVNRMPSKNLAVIFGPTLMKFNTGNEEQQMRDMIQTVEFILLQSHILFADYNI